MSYSVLSVGTISIFNVRDASIALHYQREGDIVKENHNL